MLMDTGVPVSMNSWLSALKKPGRYRNLSIVHSPYKFHRAYSMYHEERACWYHKVLFSE